MTADASPIPKEPKLDASLKADVLVWEVAMFEDDSVIKTLEDGISVESEAPTAESVRIEAKAVVVFHPVNRITETEPGSKPSETVTLVVTEDCGRVVVDMKC